MGIPNPFKTQGKEKTTFLSFITGHQKKKLGAAAVSPNLLIVHHLIQFCDHRESVPIDFVREIFIYIENSLVIL